MGLLKWPRNLILYIIIDIQEKLLNILFFMDDFLFEGGPNSPSPNTPRPHEEQAYLDKLKQLQKYIEPLKRMINRLTTGKDEG